MNKLNISNKLKLLLSLPLVALIILAFNISYEKYTSYNEFKYLNKSVQLSIKTTSLVHELQKERGMTAGYIGSKSLNFKKELPLQRLLSDKKILELKNFLNTMELKYYGKKYQTLLNITTTHLSKLSNIRKQVLELKISGKEAISYYTNMNASFLELVRDTSRFSKNALMSRELGSYTNFLLAKERAGIERAIGAVTFAKNQFAKGMKLKFYKLISEQEAYLSSFVSLSNENILNFYNQTLNENAIKEVNRMREVALNTKNEKNFSIDSYYWFKMISEKINLLKKIDDKIAQNLLNDADVLANKAKIEMFFYIITSFLIIILSLSLARSINKNILNGIVSLTKGLEDFFKFLNKEDSNCNEILIDKNRDDEIAHMARKINAHILQIKDVILDDTHFMKELELSILEIKKGHLEKRLEYSPKSDHLKELKITINEMLTIMNKNIGANINSITDILNSYANLDFTNSLKDAKGKVEVSILNVKDMITIMLQNSKKSGLGIKESSNELLKNVDILNHSSNETASSLEETAASLEEITATLKNNTLNVNKMTIHVDELEESVTSGQNLANKTSEAMNELHEQVNSINEAILVIDQIAFQTNILSLNAAVEAATAGEVGKGFAVVAQEVRNLANKSADAAKDIKSLVENAKLKADTGKNISNEMNDGYKVLNKNINDTKDLIQEINISSEEQTSSIIQINDAVNLLDQQTQKNAAVASQTAQIAKNTSLIASQIVNEANEKEFEGKDSIIL